MIPTHPYAAHAPAPARHDDPGYSGRRTAEIVGITYRQLDYWARTDLVRPSLCDASGSGSRRRYSRADLNDLVLIRQLLDAGHRLEQVRAVMADLPDDWADAGHYLAIGRPSVRSLWPTVRVAGDIDLDTVMGDYIGPVTVLAVDQLLQVIDLAVSVLAA